MVRTGKTGNGDGNMLMAAVFGGLIALLAIGAVVLLEK